MRCDFARPRPFTRLLRHLLPPFVVSASDGTSKCLAGTWAQGRAAKSTEGRCRNRERKREWSIAMGRSPGGHTFAPRQPCVISARRHVAFQCIISAGKMPPDMQNQISARAALSPRLSHFHRLSLSLLPSPFPATATVRPSRFAVSSASYSSLSSRFCFWYPLPSIGSREPGFRVVSLPLLLRRRSRSSYLLKAVLSALRQDGARDTFLSFCSLETTR